MGQSKKSFYDRRPQSRMRINSKAHAGFCGACGPCSCNPSRRTTATGKKDISQAKGDTWWGNKLNHAKHRKKTPSFKTVKENDIQEEAEEVTK